MEKLTQIGLSLLAAVSLIKVHLIIIEHGFSEVDEKTTITNPPATDQVITDDILEKHPQHHHYFIEEGWLCEAYKTCRGMRHTFIMQMPGEPDNDNYQFPVPKMDWLQQEKCRKYHG